MGNSRREPLGSAEHTTFVPYANVAVAALDKRFPIRGARAEASAKYGTQDHPSPVHFRKLPPMKTPEVFLQTLVARIVSRTVPRILARQPDPVLVSLLIQATRLLVPLLVPHKKMRVLIVGASGLLGRALVARFTEAGHEVSRPQTLSQTIATR